MFALALGLRWSNGHSGVMATAREKVERTERLEVTPTSRLGMFSIPFHPWADVDRVSGVVSHVLVVPGV